MNSDELKKGLIGSFKDYEIVLTLHAKLKAETEQISVNEVIENIKNPKFLQYVEKDDDFKYRLYFDLSNALSHKYVIEINNFEKKIKVVTLVKLRKKWQKKAEKYVK
ncbi:MAG: hypothetical protein Q7S21_00840 [archaeon]|nr:hypothetical protein [archaeon]